MIVEQMVDGVVAVAERSPDNRCRMLPLVGPQPLGSGSIPVVRVVCLTVIPARGVEQLDWGHRVGTDVVVTDIKLTSHEVRELNLDDRIRLGMQAGCADDCEEDKANETDFCHAETSLKARQPYRQRYQVNHNLGSKDLERETAMKRVEGLPFVC